jgi:hypothetical protein
MKSLFISFILAGVCGLQAADFAATGPLKETELAPGLE